MTYKELVVWQKAMDLVDEIYRVTAKFPKEEIYGLSSQMRRAAISIPSNVAEGFKRGGNKELVRFFCFSSGSNAELETQILIAERQGYISEVESKNLQNQTEQISKILNALIKKHKQ